MTYKPVTCAGPDKTIARTIAGAGIAGKDVVVAGPADSTRVAQRSSNKVANWCSPTARAGMQVVRANVSKPECCLRPASGTWSEHTPAAPASATGGIQGRPPSGMRYRWPSHKPRRVYCCSRVGEVDQQPVHAVGAHARPLRRPVRLGATRVGQHLPAAIKQRPSSRQRCSGLMLLASPARGAPRDGATVGGRC